MNKEHKRQITGLVRETIRGALGEDFIYKNHKEAADALKELRLQVNSIHVSDFYFPEVDDEW